MGDYTWTSLYVFIDGGTPPDDRTTIYNDTIVITASFFGPKETLSQSLSHFTASP